MKKLNLHFKIILLISAFLISSNNIYSQWTIAGDLPGLTGPRPQVSVVDENTAIVIGGLTINATYKTTNGGTNWTALNTSTFNIFWAVCAKDANTIFAGDNGSSGVLHFYKTINGGTTWTIIDSITLTSTNVPGFRQIRFCNSIPSFGIAYAEANTGETYIYKTRDGGNTWSRALLPLFPGYFISQGLNVIDSLFYGFGTVGSPPSIILTTDGGVTWNLRDVNLPSLGGDVTRGLAFKDKFTGIAATSGSDQFISRTTNGGLNWVNIDLGNTVYNIIGPSTRWIEGTDICYLTSTGTSGGQLNQVIKSTNGGLNWTSMTTAGIGTIYMDTKRIGSNIYGYAISAVPGAFGGNQVLKVTDVIPSQQILYGDSITLGNGVVRTFVQLDIAGRREQIGVSMTAGVMNNLPDTITRTFVLALPAPVAANDTTFNHVFFTWSPDGHGPPGVFEVPHFDFHFSTVSVAERQSVIPGIDPVYYPREFVPRDYKRDNFPPGVVPNRGLHWGDSTRIITNQNFTNTFIITTYRGKRFSWEPMITRAYLLTNPDTLIEIKQAQLYRRAGDYPLNYSITYNAGNQTYNVVLRDFERSEGVTKNPFIGMSNSKINGVPFSVPPLCGTSIPAGYYDSVDFDIIASDWDIGDSVTLTAFFDTPLPAGSKVTFTPILPVTGYPARTHLHFVSNGPYNGKLKLFASDESGNRDSCSITFDIPLPVELTSFVSTIYENDVTLNWTTAAEDNNAGFEIERRDARGQTQDVWNKIGFVQGHGNSTQPISYSFVDRGLNTGKYNYRLKQIDFNGNFKYYNLSNEVGIGVPLRFELSQNYPNPFNPKTIINYELPLTNNVSIKVYDISGREVAILINQIQNPGYYSVDFDGNNFSSGVYFYKLEVEGNVINTKRMVLLK